MQGESWGWLAPSLKLLVSHFTPGACLPECGWGFLPRKLIGSKLLDIAAAFVY